MHAAAYSRESGAAYSVSVFHPLTKPEAKAPSKSCAAGRQAEYIVARHWLHDTRLRLGESRSGGVEDGRTGDLRWTSPSPAPTSVT